MFSDGPSLWDGTLDTGFEGVVSKRAYGRYHPGVRTTDWRKTKHMRTGRFVVGGWVNDHEGRPEALLVGRPTDDGRLTYAGPVRLFSARRLIEGCDDLRTPESAFNDGPTGRRLVFLRPEIEVEVSYRTVTATGLIGGFWAQGTRSPFGAVNSSHRSLVGEPLSTSSSSLRGTAGSLTRPKDGWDSRRKPRRMNPSPGGVGNGEQFLGLSGRNVDDLQRRHEGPT